MALSRLIVPLLFVLLSLFQVEALDLDLSTLSGTFDKLKTCKPETQLSLVSDLALNKWWPPHIHIDPEACINITLDIADFERVTYSVLQLGYKIFNDSKVVGIAIFNCKSELPDVFNLLDCAITQLETSGPLVHDILEGIKGIIDEINVDYQAIVVDIKKCLGLAPHPQLEQLLRKIHTHC